MKPVPRDYQHDLIRDVRTAWSAGARNVLMRSETGSGKTVTLGAIVEEEPGPSCVIAHRAELVGQLSLCLARYGIRHSLIASVETKRSIAALHIAELGQCYYTPGARCVVASVDTLVRQRAIEPWARTVRLWVVDEAAHLVNDNKWYRAISLFTHPDVRGLGPTATPNRADGKGLGAHHDGVFHTMVEGPAMRWLIDHKYLADYRIVCVESDLKSIIEAEDTSAGGDWSPEKQRAASRKSHIVGDIVQEYLRWAPDKLTCTFLTDVETAQRTADAFRAAGVPAEILSGQTDDNLRRQILRRFAAREIRQLCSVDIISEGFDLPAIECVQFARPTQSLGLYLQQAGRALRPKADGSKALLIDHVGNVLRHGVPDKPRVWTLDRRDRTSRGASDAIPLRVCIACFQPTPRHSRDCMWCGAGPPEPQSRSLPAHVDGDLAELDAATLERLRQGTVLLTVEQERTRLSATGLPDRFVRSNVKAHAERIDAQTALRDAMAAWAGGYHASGETDSMIQRRFFLTYGHDVLSACALGRADSEALRIRIDESVNSA